jgi:hypothetical protein
MKIAKAVFRMYSLNITGERIAIRDIECERLHEILK